MTALTSVIGTEAWWQSVAQQGTPFIAREKGENALVTFLWRDPDGDEFHSAIRNVWLNIIGITDHHRGGLPHSLKRIAGTDVWQTTLSLSQGWRGSYSLMPDTADELPAEPLSMLSLRQWWQRKFPLAQPDRYNPLPGWQSGRGHWVSPLHMPAAPAQPEWQTEDNRPEPLNFSWESALLGNTRDVAILATGEENPLHRPLVILLDGKFWLRSQPVAAPLTTLTHSGDLTEAVYVFIDSVDNSLRAAELPCNPLFWQAIQQELLPELRRKIAFSGQAKNTVVVGQSFGGLAAVYAVLNWPERFGCALSQSGSFWWPHRDHQAKQATGLLIQQVVKGIAGMPGQRIALDAGWHEKIILDSNRQLYPLLVDAGLDVRFREIDGGHDALCWRGGITNGLKWLWSDSASSEEIHKLR